MRTKHLNAVHLSAADRAQLDQLLHAGTTNTRVVTRARILLKCAAGWTDAQCADAFEVHPRTVRRVRERFVADGIEGAVYDRPRSGAPVKLDGKLQALVVATACSPAPAGHTHWTLRLLADRFVELEVVDHLAPNTVRAILKKRVEAPSETAMVSAGWRECAVCGPHGRRARPVCGPARSAASRDLF